MKFDRHILRIGAAVILLATFLRLCTGGFFVKAGQWLIRPEVTSFLLFAGTGRVFSPAPPQTDNQTTEPPEQQQNPPAQAVFGPEDSNLLSVKNQTNYRCDTQSLLHQPLTWKLTGSEPTVLIFHSHGCESYENTEGYTESSYYRTTDSRYNMVSIGEVLASKLRANGIGVIHDTSLHDYPSYNDAYPRSCETVAQYLQTYPSIRLVLDIHRDAYEDSKGNQASRTLQINGTETSQLMILIGTDIKDSRHDGWQDNLALGIKLQVTLEKMYPGLCRPLHIRTPAYNQFLSPGALLIEVGTAGDTRQNALAAAELLADGIIALSQGAK